MILSSESSKKSTGPTLFCLTGTIEDLADFPGVLNQASVLQKFGHSGYVTIGLNTDGTPSYACAAIFLGPKLWRFKLSPEVLGSAKP
jgi:hypothetical protein